jgi:hypothetical protein
VSSLVRFKPIFELEAAEFILAQTKRRKRRLMDLCYAIAADPYAKPDFVLNDADGRPISHVSTDGYLLSYWVDERVKRVVIAEIEEVE